jgi:hypothetical protein
MRRRIVGGTNRPACGAAAERPRPESALPARAPDRLFDGAGGAACGGSSTGGRRRRHRARARRPAALGVGGSLDDGASQGVVVRALRVLRLGDRGVAGLTTLTRRGGPEHGAAGFGGSAFLATGAFFPPFAGTGCSANMSPPGSDTLR